MENARILITGKSCEIGNKNKEDSVPDANLWTFTEREAGNVFHMTDVSLISRCGDISVIGSLCVGMQSPTTLCCFVPQYVSPMGQMLLRPTLQINKWSLTEVSYKVIQLG